MAAAALEEADDPESFFNHTGLIDPPLILPDGPINGFSVPPASTSPQGSSEDLEIFSDIALSYISELLMEEEEMDGRAALLYDQEGPALQDAVKPFYDVLREQFPPAPPDLLPLFSDSPEDGGGGSNSSTSGSPSRGGGFPDRDPAAVATDDHRSAIEHLKHIRQHSSMDGDGSQRLAHCFAEGLEARLAGTGVERYHSMEAKSRSAAAVLKAYHLYLAACPFKKVSHFAANQTILNAAEGATRLHIVDFGIWYGFQWPCLIQRLS